ncbi:hypothetical protein F4808DRAFT_75399 [Astrocystis sublimbata]|nr:hypothetical protein F4808DRAFT_75399 [Astrocystis sublimbata]
MQHTPPSKVSDPTDSSFLQSGIDVDVDVEPAEEKITRTLSGALADFEAGASVAKVLFTSDLSAIQITGLPRNSTPASVTEFLRSKELDVSELHRVQVVCDLYTIAKVEAKDPRFAEKALAKIGTRNGVDAVNAALALVETFASAGSSSALRVDCKKVRCSWQKQTRTAWLNFWDYTTAKRISNGFNRGEYKVLGQLVEPSEPDHDPHRREWVVCLTDVPADATKPDIPHHAAQGIRISKPTYTTDAETCAVIVQSLFTAVGPLEWWEFTQDASGKRVLASGRFAKEDDAKEALRTLDNSQLPFNTEARLAVQLVYCARFKVSSLIYDVVSEQIKANISRWKAHCIHFTAYDQPSPPKWYRTLKIEGESHKRLTEAKDTISAILAGMVARKGSSNLWHPALRGNGEIAAKLTQLQHQTGVMIQRNKAKSEIRLFGLLKKCEEVQTRLSDILKIRRSEEFAIDLTAEKFLWARLEGYKKLTAELGPDSVSLDITSTPKRIIVTGTSSQHALALSIIDSQNEPGRDETASGQDCSVCWTEAENAITTQCDHAYCLDCFERMCLSSPTQDSEVKIRCVGNSGDCGTVLSLAELQEHLSLSAFEELLEKSFASYVRLRPDQLRHCPSADCDHVYRANEPTRVLACNGCLKATCTACHAQHEPLTCADYQDVASGRREANEKLKKDLGIKDCPKCKTPLEKTDGCDHITCRCGAHICWICLETFEDSDPCYEHMDDEHGSIGLDHYQEEFGD